MELAIPPASGVLDSELVDELAVPSSSEDVVEDGDGARASVSDPVAVAPVSMTCVPDMLSGSFADSVSSGAVIAVVWDTSASSVLDGDSELASSFLSLLFQFIWIIGAKRLKAVIFASTLGMVTSSTSEPSHTANDTVVDVATVKHVWPPMLAHSYPLWWPD